MTDALDDARWLARGAAFVWLATGLSVLHPFYREVGGAALDELGLPHALMWATCAFEVALGVYVALAKPTWWLTGLQVGMVAVFTVILAVAQPILLAHPFGVLTKNLPFIAVLGTAWLVARDGWTPRATWLLRGGMAVIWVTEGLFPKVLFQQPMELAVVENSGLVPFSASTFLVLMGLAQVASGVAALLLKGRPLKWLLLAQGAALVVLPLLVSWQQPLLWFHPFGPMTKNVPILVGTWVVWRRC
jgi:hypothetical protein